MHDTDYPWRYLVTTAGKLGASALIAVGLLSIGLSGCSSKGDNKSASGGTSSPSAATAATSISATDLQSGLSSRISTATPPKSVTCSAGLPGQVGAAASCEVVINDANAVQANVTVTKVNGANIDYDFTPSMTKEQLEKAFSANVSAQVTCDGGLDGKIGSSTTCHVTKNGTTDDATVSVSKVQGLFMTLSTGQS